MNSFVALSPGILKHWLKHHSGVRSDTSCVVLKRWGGNPPANAFLVENDPPRLKILLGAMTPSPQDDSHHVEESWGEKGFAIWAWAGDFVVNFSGDFFP